MNCFQELQPHRQLIPFAFFILLEHLIGGMFHNFVEYITFFPH